MVPNQQELMFNGNTFAYRFICCTFAPQSKTITSKTDNDEKQQQELTGSDEHLQERRQEKEAEDSPKAYSGRG